MIFEENIGEVVGTKKAVNQYGVEITTALVIKVEEEGRFTAPLAPEHQTYPWDEDLKEATPERPLIVNVIIAKPAGTFAGAYIKQPFTVGE